MSKNTQGIIGQMVNFYWKPLKKAPKWMHLCILFMYFILNYNDTCISKIELQMIKNSNFKNHFCGSNFINSSMIYVGNQSL